MITDMMQSEKVFLVDGTNITPLIPSSGDVAKQKHINNKLVNYTLAFRVANDLKNHGDDMSRVSLIIGGVTARPVQRGRHYPR